MSTEAAAPAAPTVAGDGPDGYAVTRGPVDLQLLHEVEQFLYREARLADDHEYDAWEALWADDAIYWVPANGDDIDPTTSMSVIFDNRSRIGLRIKQYHTGKRHSQTPPSALRRNVTNVELLGTDPDADDLLLVGANFLVFESRERGIVHWAGRYEYKLRRKGETFEIAYKKVRIVGNDRPLHTLAFLI
ncbi:MAG: aromatic-ring-hydroxylating dioxygenase subunit beta [Solirubrobacteraceae bacterium]|nr:aromatic-ring-hydroxylating dioxygenase subunit beta [Solirubrobacteraceae bacterium]